MIYPRRSPFNSIPSKELDVGDAPGLSPLLPRALSFKDHQVPNARLATKPAAAEVATPVAVSGDPSSIAPLVANISKQALKKRVERFMKPRQDGSFVVPEELVREWNGKTNQDLILKEFQESGLDKDHGNALLLGKEPLKK